MTWLPTLNLSALTISCARPGTVAHCSDDGITTELVGGQVPFRKCGTWRNSFALGFAMIAMVASGCGRSGGDNLWNFAVARRYVERWPGSARIPESSHKFYIVTPLGISRERVVISGTELVKIGENAQVIPDPRLPVPVIVGTGEVEIGRNSLVGSVYGLGSCTTLGIGSQVLGIVKASNLIGREDSFVRAGVLARAGHEIETYSWPVEFNEFTLGDRVADRSGSMPKSLPPGSYGHIEVKADGALRLRSGTYYFRTLDVESKGMLELDNTAGPIQVWVRDSLSLRNRTLDWNLEPSIMIGYAGSAPPTLTSVLRGTFIAPWATLTLPNTQAPHSGAFFARSVQIAAGAKVDFRSIPFDQRRQDAPTICGSCANIARATGAECCANLARALSNIALADMACSTSCKLTQPFVHSCKSTCTMSLTRHHSEAQAWFNACLHANSMTYDRCQLDKGYRPGACSELGYGGYEPVTCDHEIY